MKVTKVVPFCLPYVTQVLHKITYITYFVGPLKGLISKSTLIKLKEFNPIDLDF